jgi:hypothetical protein
MRASITLYVTVSMSAEDSNRYNTLDIYNKYVVAWG